MAASHYYLKHSLFPGALHSYLVQIKCELLGIGRGPPHTVGLMALLSQGLM